MTGRWRQVRTQSELEKVVEAGDFAEIVGAGYFSAYGSATVSASGSATVSAYDSATVSASGSATVRAYGSATVRAYDSATVRASGSVTVRAYGSATVRAYDSATVSASTYVAVHKLSQRASIDGGHVIEPPDLTIAENWLAYYGIEPDENGVVILFKAVGDDWHSGYRADYSPGATPVAGDFKPTNECGAGLHFSPRPFMALTYSMGPKFVACPVVAADLVPVGSAYSCDKAKAPRVISPGCWEVTEDGVRVPPVEVSA
jgi:hypothetical protein